MRPITLTICLALLSTCGFAQAESDQTKADSLKSSTGRAPPEDKGQLQPQGWTGPNTTTSGGAPAESPQGQSPPGMQSAPEGSTKTAVESKK
ncbi:hypothetical protein [Bradyrhizobium australiense]|uniref:Secreted protein n=1 Tax=Bradyrhizobium australiense TaxID=2721161 RepID=A0A7Y4GRV2_9BRAD|nr:hypothetical protein [Bradyrhizobium australiense]NOJ40691.1 hypothetical protein [Bradyrhizobium australiense]